MKQSLLFVLFAHHMGTRLAGLRKPGDPHDEFIHFEHQINVEQTQYYKQLWALLVYWHRHAVDCHNILYSEEDYVQFRETFPEVPVQELSFFVVPRVGLVKYHYIKRGEMENPHPSTRL